MTDETTNDRSVVCRVVKRLVIFGFWIFSPLGILEFFSPLVTAKKSVPTPHNGNDNRLCERGNDDDQKGWRKRVCLPLTLPIS
jgi:hypothetical protein